MNKLKTLLLSGIFAILFTTAVHAQAPYSYPYTNNGKYPVKTLTTSEYPSWSALWKAVKDGLVYAEPGLMGPKEMEWKIDMHMRFETYDAGIGRYEGLSVDAITITNVDIAAISLKRKTVFGVATSISDGADVKIVPRTVTYISQIKGKPQYLFIKSVAGFVEWRNLQNLGVNVREYTKDWVHKDPEIIFNAYMASSRTEDDKYPYSDLWEPFRTQILGQRKDLWVLWSSGSIHDGKSMKGEVVDGVGIAADVYDTEEGFRFACLIADISYTVNDSMRANPNQTLLDITEKFGTNLTVQNMRDVVKNVKFLDTPELGIKTLTSKKSSFVFNQKYGRPLPEVMESVLEYSRFCGMIQKNEPDPTIGYGTKKEVGDVNLRFDVSAMKAVQEKRRSSN